MRIRLGTRQSPLAMWQATHISNSLQAAGHEVEIVKIVTTGDISTTPLGSGGGVGLFTKEIQRALLDNRCDLAVHSLKDLPTQPVPGLPLSGSSRTRTSQRLLCFQRVGKLSGTAVGRSRRNRFTLDDADPSRAFARQRPIYK